MPEVLKEDQYAEWDAFVREAKGGTIFHLSWFLRPLTRELQIHVLRSEDGKIEAGQVIAPTRFLGTRASRRPSGIPYSGPLVLPSQEPNLAERNTEEKRRMLRLLAESPPLGMYDYVLPPEWTDMMPFIWNGFDVSVYYTYQIPPAPAEQWQEAMSKNHWKNLRRARNAMKELDGKIEVNGDVREFFGMMMDLSHTDQFHVTFNAEQFVHWWNRLREQDAAALYVFRDGKGNALTGNIAVWDWRCLYVIVGGVRGGRLTGPEGYVHRLVFEHAILDAHRRNLTFDFEGSVLPGIEPYFRGWGGRCVPKYRAVKIRTPWTYATWVLHRYWTGHRHKTWFVEK